MIVNQDNLLDINDTKTKPMLTKKCIRRWGLEFKGGRKNMKKVGYTNLSYNLPD